MALQFRLEGLRRRASLVAVGSFCAMASIDVGAQVPDAFADCEFVPAPAQGLLPDYSLMDAMVTEGAPTDGKIYPRALCVGSKSAAEPLVPLTWQEARPEWQTGQSRNITVARRVWFAKPKNSTQMTLPLIIWSHPAGDTDVLEVGSAARVKVAEEAVRHGYAFMSLQYRHPIASQKWFAPPAPPLNQFVDGAEPPPGTMYPATDIAEAVQWAKYNNVKLGIDPDNVFLVGQSRGSLGVLTALMGDQKKTPPLGAGDEPYMIESSLPNAVFAVQAQTTYIDAQLKDFFIKHYATAAVTKPITDEDQQFPLCREFPATRTGRFDYWCHYDKATQNYSNTVTTPLSSVDALDANDTPPIWLRYERTPLTTDTITLSGLYVNDPGTYQDNPDIDTNGANCSEATLPSDKVRKCFDVHHPNFGAKLRKKWTGFTNPTSYVFVQYAPTGNAAERTTAREGFFSNYFCFFMQYERAGGAVYNTLTEPGDAKRVASIEAENATRDPDQKIPTEKCRLREVDVWP